MNPIDVFYSWQSVVLAVAVSGVVQAVKRTLDTVYGTTVRRRGQSDHPGVESRQVGRSLRKQSVLLSRIVLPLLPIIVGAVLAVLVPLRPEVLSAYAEDKAGGKDWTVYALWGSAIGQFADYLYQQAKRNLPSRFGSPDASPSSPPPSSSEAEEDEDHPNA